MSASGTIISAAAGASPQSSFRYLADDQWTKFPTGWNWTESTSVAIDSQDRVFVFNRSEHPVMIFEPDGTLVEVWGEGMFTRPHGITIGPDDSVYLTDDLDHTVRKYTPDGRLQMTLGTSGKPSNTGNTSIDYRTIRRAGEPFNFPTNVALAADGALYIADGYGNARIHKFSPQGKLLFSWGEPGGQPGQFRIPHGIAIDAEGVVFIADRENCRVQRFSPAGEFLSEWRDLARPCQVAFDPSGRVYVAELGFRAGMWPGTSPPAPDATGGRVSVFDPQGELLARWGGGDNPTAAGDFFAPHDIRVDSHHNVYVAEVTMTAGGNRGLVSPDCHSFQKFTVVE